MNLHTHEHDHPAPGIHRAVRIGASACFLIAGLLLTGSLFGTHGERTSQGVAHPPDAPHSPTASVALEP